MTPLSSVLALLAPCLWNLILNPSSAQSFRLFVGFLPRASLLRLQADSDNKAMSFLKKIGKVGGESNRDFTVALGVDEGPTGKSLGSKSLRKSNTAYLSCIDTGVVDDCTETFPFTSSGTQWRGITDRIMGGKSTASLERLTEFYGKTANVLRGRVVAYNHDKGFIQMTTNLSNDQQNSKAVDASDFDGIELDLLFKSDSDDVEESFNVHLKTEDCTQSSSYRSSFLLQQNEQWKTVRLSWQDFSGFGDGLSAPFDPSSLVRIGIVVLHDNQNDEDSRDDVTLGLSSLRFYP
jgi:hypothetical protein